jgi:hypothetical protein
MDADDTGQSQSRIDTTQYAQIMTCLQEQVAISMVEEGQEPWQPGLREGAELVKSGL